MVGILLNLSGCQDRLVAASPTPAPQAVATRTPVPKESPRPAFEVPDHAERLRALGENAPSWSTSSLPQFRAISAPGSGDWLSAHSEEGQSFAEYVASKPNLPKTPRDKIYIQPLGPWNEEVASLESLRFFTSCFFGLEVVVLEPQLEIEVTNRVDFLSKRRQWLTGDLLDGLEKQLPQDAYCLLGVTLTDLYPKEQWSYVFGTAYLKKRVGVYSLARYDPQFFGDARAQNWKAKFAERSCKVLAHETGHMLGMGHCIYFDCLMNGSNHLAELDSQSSMLCPVCLRKFDFALKPKLEQRYEKLAEFYESQGLEELSERIRSVSEAIQP